MNKQSILLVFLALSLLIGGPSAAPVRFAIATHPQNVTAET